MNADIEEQEDELLALESIFDSEEFVRDESKFAGEIRACVELPAGFNVLLKEGDTLRHWLTHTQLSAVSDQLTDLYQSTGGAVVLFSWVQFLKEDALKFLDIHTLLELPSDEHSPQEPLNAALLEPKNNQPNPKSGPTEDPLCNVSDSCKPDLSARSLEEENPRVFLTDGHDHSNQISSDASEAKQISEFTADHQNDLSSAAGKLKHGQEEFLNEGDVSASLLLSSSSSDPLDQSEQGAASLPPHSSESSQNEDQTLSGLSLTPSQTLLSQLLIHNAAQKQKMFATTVFDCGVCFEGWLGSDCVQLPECGHIFCRACLGKFCKLQIKEGNVRGVTCPDADCPATPTPAQVRSLVGEELFDRYDRLLLQSTLDCMGDVVYCPRTSCGSAVIVEKSSRAAQCSVCGFAFCVSCRKTYHGTEECRAKKSTKTQKYSWALQTCHSHKKFCGVVFTEENTVNLVASNWYVDGKCWWLNYATDDKISKAIRRFEEPGPGYPTYESDTDSEPVAQKTRGVIPQNAATLPFIPPPCFTANSQDQQHLNDISWNTRRLGSVASDGRDQGGRGHFTQLMGPTTPRNEHVFRPTFRVGGDSGPIPCTAAELHGLLLLENIKQQVNQLAGTLNILMAKVGSGLHAPTYEMPEEFQFPLDSDGELERFEEWLRNPLNERMKTDLVSDFALLCWRVDTKRVVWNILARMITCTVARRINWKGVNGKRAFSKMAMKIVLF
ncbi:E3 ubiquitin-protein ligase RNF14, partial [Dissostichus eleginoides]